MLDEVEGVGKARAAVIQEGLRRITDASSVEHYV